MDARVTLGLMAHVRLMFAQPNTVLSFLVPPVALSAGEMRAVAGSLADPADKGAPHDFAHLVNQCPTVPVSSGSGDQMLWDLCDNILHQSGQVASVERSPSEEAAVRAAEKVLFTVDDQGVRLPTQAAKLYAQYRDIWFTSQEAYRARELAARSPAADDALRAAWTVDEPALRADIAAIEAEWRERGFRAEVETARATIATLAARGSMLQWDAWSQNLNFFLKSRTDVVSGQEFCLTSYTPADVVDSAGWIKLDYSGAQFEQLIKDAPEELRSRLDPSGTGPAVAKASFACTSVGIIRSWFDSEIFRARFWRFADAARLLSDGGSPPRGDWPYYVSGLVLARNVSVELASTQPVAVRDHRIPPGVVVRDHRIPPEVIVRDHRIPGLFAARMDGPSPMAAAFGTAPPVRFERRMLIAGEADVKPPPAEVLATLRATQVTRLQRTMVAVAGFIPPPATPAPASDEILILAFICSPVLKCPNPDPALFPN